MKLDDELLDRLSAEALASPRLRQNFNLHASLEAPSQRMLNALETGTEVPIHRHTHTSETYILIRGALEVTLYDEAGEPAETYLLSRESDCFGVDIPAGAWHSLRVLAPQTVIFEAKDGPYTPLTPENLLEK